MLTPKQIEDARKQLGINTNNPQSPTASSLIERLEKSNKPNYVERVKQDIKQGFQSAKEDISSTDNRSAVSKGLSATSNVASAVVSPIAEAPVIKQIGEKLNKGIEFAGDKLADTFSPEFNEGLADIPDAEFNKAIQPVEDIANVGNIANTILIAKGGQKGTKLAKEGVVKTGQGIADSTGKVAKSVSKVTGEVIPSADRVVNYQVSRALDLTAGDIKNINLATGNEVGAFLANKNLIRGNKVETTKALQDFFDTNYKTVREEIGKVKKTYIPDQVPRYKQALQEIQKQVGETTGLEEVAKEVNNLIKKKEVVLDDVQRAKELLDEHFSLYKVTGDVKEGVAKKGLSNLRKDLKDFIEKEVKEETGSEIGVLNNEVSTAKSTLNAIEARSTRGLTSSNIKVGDFGSAGIGFMVGGVPGALVAVFGKKVLESSAVRLKIAKWLDSVSDAKKARIESEIKKGVIPTEIKSILNQSSVSKNAKIPNTNRAKNSIIPK